MVKLDQFQVYILNPDGLLNAGDILYGSVTVGLGSRALHPSSALGHDRRVQLQSLTIVITGEGHNMWVNKTSDKVYEASEVYLKETIPLLKQPTILDSGVERSLKFQLPLPPYIPSSFEGDYGNIRYSCQAHVVLLDLSQSAYSLHSRRNSAVDQGGTAQRSAQEYATERYFPVVARLNLADNSLTKHPIEAVDAMEFTTCCCVYSGSVRAAIQVQRCGFIPGQQLIITGDIHNESRKTLDGVSVTLIQHARFRAWSRHENAEDTKELCYHVAKITKGQIPPRRTLRFKQEPMTVPSLIPTYQGDILTVYYLLKVEAQPGIELEIPMTIGTLDE